MRDNKLTEESNSAVNACLTRSLTSAILTAGLIGLVDYLYDEHPFTSWVLFVPTLYYTLNFTKYLGMGLVINYAANMRENDKKDTE